MVTPSANPPRLRSQNVCRTFSSALAVFLFFAGSAGGADAMSKLKGAIQKLNESTGYTWAYSTTAGPGDRMVTVPREGRLEAPGLMHLTTRARNAENESEFIIQNGKMVIRTKDGWKTSDELIRESGQGATATSSYVREAEKSKPAGEEMAELLRNLENLREESGGWISGSIKAGFLDQQLRRGARNAATEISVVGASGTVRVLVRDGVVSQCVTRIQAKVATVDRQSIVDRSTVIDFRNIGSTRIVVPDEARKKLGIR
jgi:hypothetical protein